MQSVAPAAPSSAPWWSSGHAFGRALRLGTIVGLFGVAVLFRVPLCPFAIITRQPCPGCGLTRATLALMGGHLHEGFHYHPLAIVISPLVMVAFAYNGISYVRRGVWFASES